LWRATHDRGHAALRRATLPPRRWQAPLSGRHKPLMFHPEVPFVGSSRPPPGRGLHQRSFPAAVRFGAGVGRGCAAWSCAPASVLHLAARAGPASNRHPRRTTPSPGRAAVPASGLRALSRAAPLIQRESVTWCREPANWGLSDHGAKLPRLLGRSGLGVLSLPATSARWVRAICTPPTHRRMPRRPIPMGADLYVTSPTRHRGTRGRRAENRSRGLASPRWLRDFVRPHPGFDGSPLRLAPFCPPTTGRLTALFGALARGLVDRPSASAGRVVSACGRPLPLPPASRYILTLQNELSLGVLARPMEDW